MKSTLCRGLSACMLAVILYSPVLAQSTLRLAGVNGMTHVFKNRPVTGTATVSINSARNESESFQVVMTASGGSVRVVNAAMSALAGPGGATIPANSATLYRVEYVNINPLSQSAENNWGGTGWTTGEYPDPLIPLIDPVNGGQVHQSEGYPKYALPIDIPAGENRAVWVDIATPTTVPAGNYTGTCTVTLSDNRTATIPVSLTVLDFTLPKWPSMKQYWANTFWYLTSFYPGVAFPSAEYNAVERRIADELKKHRMEPPLPFRFTPAGNPNGTLYYTDRADSLRVWLNDYNPSVFRLPTVSAPSSDTAFRSYFTNYINWMNANGLSSWLSKTFYLLKDEPNSAEHYNYVAHYGALVPSTVKRMVTEQTFTQNSTWVNIDPAVDIWVPLWTYTHGPSIAAKQSQGDEVWSYICSAQTTPSYHPDYATLKGKRSPWWQVDRPLYHHRFTPWINYRYKMTGYLYWQIMSPWETNPWYDIYDNNNLSNGEGNLVYPGSKCGFNAPCPSIRMKAIRDSMDDYEYMLLMEKAKGRDAVLQIVK
ncbi:MAG: DUF4091 domain-containing protein, partial [Candidatus Latescibacterota bacterium]